MKKSIILVLFPILTYSNTSNIIDKIIYNGKENEVEIKLNSNLKENTLLDVSKIDTLVDNFKFVKNNDIKVNIEPSKENGHVNLVVTNKKTNPFSFFIGIDNYGTSIEDGKYRYTLDLESSGLILNENINLSYTFVRPINPERKKDKELKIGEIATKIKKDELEKARKNNNLTLELSYPIKNIRTYLTYSYKDYKKSIIGNNDIYDVSGNSHRLGVKFKTLLCRIKKNKLNLITSYSYTKRKSYLEDTLLSKDNINEINIGAEYTNELLKFESIYNYKIEDDKRVSSIDTTINLKKKFKDDIIVGINVSNHLEKDNNSLEIKSISSYKIVSVDIGVYTNFKKSNPILKLGIKKDIGRLSIDSSLNYDTSFKWLFNIRFNIL